MNQPSEDTRATTPRAYADDLPEPTNAPEDILFLFVVLLTIPVFILFLVALRRYIDYKHKPNRLLRSIFCCVEDERRAGGTDMYAMPAGESTASLPPYTETVRAGEQTIAVEGERENVDVVLSVPDNTDGEPDPYPFPAHGFNHRMRYLRLLQKYRNSHPQIAYGSIGISRCNGSRLVAGLPPPAPAVSPMEPNAPLYDYETFYYSPDDFDPASRYYYPRSNLSPCSQRTLPPPSYSADDLSSFSFHTEDGYLSDTSTLISQIV
ncbi:hypothetical protein SJAG_00101 [Schizosaccharomyces japonicus yFS275]|uniref:Uncharacterized protein n=1 Tax=Schizosaccharomyces japonicus (strain yFS275 / FY16936) TaxID=402676 RepID=B6JV02_SCHJY|nr:hypothetical protein SJAG_00101 [Schizosaccharomyces japonicus yFS275]EEB05106.1 hypothetical protein SJAG_00101 [Schizosaccharomyces japonicus yFS275]